jgi:hypothetical protein
VILHFRFSTLHSLAGKALFYIRQRMESGESEMENGFH